MYSKDYISNALKNTPGGTQIVMKATHPRSGTPLVAIGWGC